MCVRYVSVGSRVRPRTFGCVAMSSEVQIVRLFRRVAWVCLVCLLLCKEEDSSPVS